MSIVFGCLSNDFVRELHEGDIRKSFSAAETTLTEHLKEAASFVVANKTVVLSYAVGLASAAIPGAGAGAAVFALAAGTLLQPIIDGKKAFASREAFINSAKTGFAKVTDPRFLVGLVAIELLALCASAGCIDLSNAPLATPTPCPCLKNVTPTITP